MGEHVKDNERWRSDGNCLLCRRYEYCSTVCKAQRQRRQAILGRFEAGRRASER